jgi:HAD superfamily hydrolase (TIGR01509 family)
MKTKAILFDLDGTLVDTLRLFPQFLAQELIEYPTAVKIHKYLYRLGKIYNSENKHSWFKINFFRAIKNDFNLSWFRLSIALIRAVIFFYVWDRTQHIFPEVIPTLKELKKQGFLLGIVSNGSPRLLKKRFAPHLGLFDVLIESKSIGVSKPSPIPLYYACQQLRISKDEAIFVGDTVVDLIAAKSAEMRIILVKTGVFGKEFPINEIEYEPIAQIPVVGKSLLEVLSKEI